MLHTHVCTYIQCHTKSDHVHTYIFHSYGISTQHYLKLDQLSTVYHNGAVTYYIKSTPSATHITMYVVNLLTYIHTYIYHFILLHLPNDGKHNLLSTTYSHTYILCLSSSYCCIMSCIICCSV